MRLHSAVQAYAALQQGKSKRRRVAHIILPALGAPLISKVDIAPPMGVVDTVLDLQLSTVGKPAMAGKVSPSLHHLSVALGLQPNQDNSAQFSGVEMELGMFFHYYCLP